MKTARDKLLSICSDEISASNEDKNCTSLLNFSLINVLIELLSKRNGFYGFESALHVFPFESTDLEIGLLDWNKHPLWIDDYKDLAKDAVYFAEDIFGGQFCIKQDGIYLFEPETGRFDFISNDLNQWCDNILKDYNFLTGYSLAHTWQKENGRIPAGYRLMPKIPFVLGGEFSIDNLYMESSLSAMKIRANIALQIRDIPDGEQIKISIP